MEKISYMTKGFQSLIEKIPFSGNFMVEVFSAIKGEARGYRCTY